MATPSTIVPVALTPETGALVIYTGPKDKVKAKRSFINFNKKNILTGVGITLIALAVPAALFYLAPSALLTVGNLALSMFSAQASVNTTLALGASLVATGVSALVGSTIALASFINNKLTVRAAMKKAAAKIAPELAVIAEAEKNSIVAQHDRFIGRLKTIQLEQMAKVQADTKLEPIACVSPALGAFYAEGKEGFRKLVDEERAARAELMAFHADATIAADEAAKADAGATIGVKSPVVRSSMSPVRQAAVAASAAALTAVVAAKSYGLF